MLRDAAGIGLAVGAFGLSYGAIAVASGFTVLQTCAYWGNSDQCAFCGIGLSLTAGRTVAKKRPEDLPG